jgi:hypothetical protein
MVVSTITGTRVLVDVSGSVGVLSSVAVGVGNEDVAVRLV